MDRKVQMYLKKIREGGGVITASIVMTASHGILLPTDKSMLAEFGGRVKLNGCWAYRLLDCAEESYYSKKQAHATGFCSMVV